MRILGIDGGGSKTTFLLTDDSDQTLAQSVSGPSNLNTVGQPAAREAILSGLVQLPLEPEVICGGFAGAGRAGSEAFYRNVLREAFPHARVIVTTDAHIAYAGAIGMKPGVLLIAGTGSIAIARQPDGTMVRTGGWGPQFGDEGGGYWIGREAIRQALRSAETGEFPGFERRVADHLGLERITDVIPAWQSGQLTIPRIATLFPQLLEMYPERPASTILGAAAIHLRILIGSAERLMTTPSKLRSFSGNVASSPLIQQLLELDLSPPVATPACGAVIWAREHAVRLPST